MTRIKQEENAMDMKIPVDIMDLPINQPQQDAPITISTSSIKRGRKSSASPKLEAEKEDCSLKKRAKNVEEAFVSTDKAADASEEEENKVIPMNKDNHFYCRRCNINIKGCREYYGHLRSEHNIKPNINRVRHVDLQPDIDDPNFYCRSCERPHAGRHQYTTHLKRVHHMLLQPFKKPKDKGVQPDPFSPNHYCTVCKKEFSKTGFKRHLLLVHKVNLKALHT
ncbi:Protein ssh4 [Mucor velutinosus]|uniref:Protein ssh4 n=1 Tax=Mucor velutinosus TaxID=708070 RepID=A0AAN7DN04_9FUNG|nr:Protein ssh4 [Mucor velutinosus]